MSDTLHQFVAGRGDGPLPHDEDKLIKCVGHSYARLRLPTAVPAIVLMVLMLLGVTPFVSTIASTRLAKKTFRVMTYNIHVGDLHEKSKRHFKAGDSK